eukprot:5275499-Prymnesium_polylepis.1
MLPLSNHPADVATLVHEPLRIRPSVHHIAVGRIPTSQPLERKPSLTSTNCPPYPLHLHSRILRGRVQPLARGHQLP